MMNFTLKQLRYFEALARHGHFGHAADASAISQPALSMQIKELEQTLGAPLFERSARRLRLTAFGEEILSRARDILRAADDLGELARHSQNQLSGKLRLGVIPTIAPYLLPQIIGKLDTSFPELDIQIRETVTPRLLEELSDGRLDTAILALPINMPEFTEIALFDEDLLLVRHARDAGTPIPSVDTLKELPLLMLEAGHCFRDQALSFCNVSNAGTRDRLDGSSLSTLVQMVGAGIGVTLIPQMAAEIEKRAAPVSISAFPSPRPSRTVGMIWRKSTPSADGLHKIAGLVKSCAPQSL